jgi:IgGFc binding protein
VEVYDTTTWGTVYDAPVGENTLLDSSVTPFELSGLSCMAREDNTRVTRPDGTVVTLRTGQSTFFSVRQAQQVTSDKPIQVVLLTADRGSTYETRWFTLRPTNTLQSSYVSPVGDSKAQTRIAIYNPASISLSFTVSTLVSGRVQNVTSTLVSKQSVYTGVIPTGSGALIVGNGPFVALSVTDSSGAGTNGDIYDCTSTAISRSCASVH